MDWSDIVQFIFNLFSKSIVYNSDKNQTRIKVIRGLSNSNGQFDTVQILNDSTEVWSGVIGENNVLPNCPIQVGQYHIQWYDSPAEGYTDILLINVPMHTSIECHEGNYPNSNPTHPAFGDSKGCLLIGESLDDQTNPTMICNSDIAFAEFKSHLPQDLNDVILEIV